MENLLHLAEEAFGNDDYEEAEKLFREVLSHLEVSLGDDHVEVAKVLFCLARCVEARGRVAEAKSIRRRAETIMCQH